MSSNGNLFIHNLAGREVDVRTVAMHLACLAMAPK